jgi:hypothetical protein
MWFGPRKRRDEISSVARGICKKGCLIERSIVSIVPLLCDSSLNHSWTGQAVGTSTAGRHVQQAACDLDQSLWSVLRHFCLERRRSCLSSRHLYGLIPFTFAEARAVKYSSIKQRFRKCCPASQKSAFL